jgi:hypothetical protein
MNEPLDPTVAAALAEAGLVVGGFARLSSHRLSAIDRIAYRIDLSPSGRVKARRLEDAATAARLCDIRRDLPPAFAPVLERHGSVLIEQWIEGEPIAASPDPDVVAQAAILLAELHGRRQIAGQVVHQVHSTTPMLVSTLESLRAVHAAGVLDERDVAVLGQALDRLDPRQALHGLVHFDFCGENMVIDRAGRLRVIDNERLGINVIGLDLGRTRYRWVLGRPEWERFRSIYADCLSVADPLADEDFWSLIAVVRSTALRLHAYPDQAQVPTKQLRAHVARLREEMS